MAARLPVAENIQDGSGSLEGLGAGEHLRWGIDAPGLSRGALGLAYQNDIARVVGSHGDRDDYPIAGPISGSIADARVYASPDTPSHASADITGRAGSYIACLAGAGACSGIEAIDRAGGQTTGH